jgi:hypothetical protein
LLIMFIGPPFLLAGDPASGERPRIKNANRPPAPWLAVGRSP